MHLSGSRLQLLSDKKIYQDNNHISLEECIKRAIPKLSGLMTKLYRNTIGFVKEKELDNFSSSHLAETHNPEKI